MSFDPTKPANGSPLSSAEMRGQLNGLKADYETQIANIPAGPPGEKGDKGDIGDQGPPFAQAVVDGVNTGAPGSAASVGVSFDGTFVHFNFDIPRGDKGDQGDPGELTQAALDTAIAGTSANTNSIATLDTPFADPDAESLRQKLNEVILNGRR